MASLSCTGSPEEIRSFESEPKIASAAAVRSPDFAAVIRAFPASSGVANTPAEGLLGLLQPESTTPTVRSTNPARRTILRCLNRMPTSETLNAKAPCRLCNGEVNIFGRWIAGLHLRPRPPPQPPPPPRLDEPRKLSSLDCHPLPLNTDEDPLLRPCSPQPLEAAEFSEAPE